MTLIVPLVVLSVAVLILGWIVWTRADAKKQLAAAFAVGASVSGGGSFFIQEPIPGRDGNPTGWICTPVAEAVDGGVGVTTSGCREIEGVRVCNIEEGWTPPVEETLVVPPCVEVVKPAKKKVR